MFSRKSLELLLDLVEIKLGYLEAADAEDRRTISELQRCRRELVTLARPQPRAGDSVTALAA
jgi:hypothetical protein